MRWVFFKILFLATICTWANKLEVNPGFKYKQSFIIPHSDAVKPFQNGDFPIYELNLIFPNSGGEAFKLNNPNVFWGLALNFTDLNNQSLVGGIVGLAPFIQKEFIQRKYVSFWYKLGSGVAYVFKPFDPITNYKNLVIGSHFNNTTDLALGSTFSFKNFTLNIGTGLHHYSNGALRRPNLGINAPYLELGIHAKLFETRHDSINTLKNEEVKHNPIYASTSFGTRRLFPGHNELYNIYQITGGYQYQFKKQRSLLFQMDVFYDCAIPYLKTYERSLKPSDSWILGGFLYYEKRYGNVGLLVGSGYYLHAIYPSFNQDWSFANKGGRFYNRAGLRFYKGNWFGQINIKAHMGEADNIEWGIGRNIF